MNPVVKVISLARSVDRRQSFAERHAGLAFEFVDAIDGKAILHEVDNAPDLFQAGLRYSPGAFGCALSHLALWQEAAENDYPVTVVEDDAVLRHDFQAQSEALLAQLPEDWDLMVWAWNFDSILSLNLMPGVSRTVMLFDQNELRRSLPAFQAMQDKPSALRLDRCFGTPAYTISPQGARKFMLGCFPLEEFSMSMPLLTNQIPNTGIDIAMNRIYASTNSYCSLPPLAVTPNEHASSLIQNRP